MQRISNIYQMIADLGTRKGDALLYIGTGIQWIQRLLWMRGDDNFPLKTRDEIMISIKDIKDVNKESIVPEIAEQPTNNISFVENVYQCGR